MRERCSDSVLSPQSSVLLFDQFLDHLGERAGFDVAGADGDEADATAAVEEDGGRHLRDAVARAVLFVVGDAEAVGDLALALEAAEEGQLFGGRKLFPFAGAVELREADDGQPAGVVFFVQRVELGDGEAAGAAPRRPEVEEHDAPAQVCEARGLLVDPVLDLDLGRRRRRRVAGRRRRERLAVVEEQHGRAAVEPRRGEFEREAAHLLYDAECFGALLRPDERIDEEGARAVDGVGALARVERLAARQPEGDAVGFARARGGALVILLLVVVGGERGVHAVRLGGRARLFARVVGQNLLGLGGEVLLDGVLDEDDARLLPERGRGPGAFGEEAAQGVERLFGLARERVEQPRVVEVEAAQARPRAPRWSPRA